MEILEQLILNGHAKKEFEKLDGKLKFTLKTLSGNEQLAIEKAMADIKGTPAFVVHNFNLLMLSYALLSYQDNKFQKESPEEKFEFVKNLDTSILDLVTVEMKEFYEECKKVVSPEGIENLSKAPSAESGSNS